MIFKNSKKCDYKLASIFILGISIFIFNSCKNNSKVENRKVDTSEQKDISDIVSEVDFESIFSLEDNRDFSIALYEILANRYEKNPDSMNQIEWNLFLSMNLENAGQSGTILTFLEEWFPEQREQVILSLTEIGAIKSAATIKLAVALLPKDGTSFFKNATKSSEQLMLTFDSTFSDYPDGSMPDLYRTYAEKHRDKFN